MARERWGQNKLELEVVLGGATSRSGVSGRHPKTSGLLPPSPAASKPSLQTQCEVRGEMLASLHLPLSPPTLPSTQTRQFYVSIQPPVGELMAPVFMSENEFKKEQGECSLEVGREGAQDHPLGLIQLHHTVTLREPQLLQMEAGLTARGSSKGFTEPGTLQ